MKETTGDGASFAVRHPARRGGVYILSMTAAMPWPPPMHIVMSP